ncbi:MAG: malto-oligosyltrehalose trehalohydrolase [Oligoflexus sp.]
MIHEFSVWSPQCKSMKLIISQDGSTQEFSLNKNSDDMWTHSVQISTDKPCFYQYRIDDDQIVPDPCSHFQPQGIDGPSELIDHSSFSWNDQNFTPPPWQKAIIYELHVGTFTAGGQFVDIINKLDYLLELGVTHIELMPVTTFSGNYGWGYDSVFPFSPHAAYGRPEELKKLVDTCHQKGLAVILDVIYNHFGPNGNYFGSFAPYHTHRYQTPWGDAINYDDDYSDQVRQMVIKNVDMWLSDYHFDGLRLDAIHAIFDQSATHILEEINQHVKILDQKLNKTHFMIAESDLNDPKVIRPLEDWGYGFQAQWSDDYHHAIHSYLTGEQTGYYADFGRLSDISKALQKGFIYDGNHAKSRKRKHGRALHNCSPRQLITCIQNHDQVGNRARGERLSQILTPDQLKLAAGLNLLAPTTPLLFQGEEWGASSPFLYFTNHQDPELATAVREGRIREFVSFGWKKEDIPDPQEALNFDLSKLQWEEKEWDDHHEILSWYKKLLKLRKQYLDGESFQFLSAKNITVLEEEKIFLMQNQSLSIVFNFADQAQTFDFKLPIKTEKILASSRSGVELKKDGIYMPAFSVGIFLKGESI